MHAADHLIEAAPSDFVDFPDGAGDRLLDAVTVVAEGGMPPIAKPLAGLRFVRARACAKQSSAVLAHPKFAFRPDGVITVEAGISRLFGRDKPVMRFLHVPKIDRRQFFSYAASVLLIPAGSGFLGGRAGFKQSSFTPPPRATDARDGYGINGDGKTCTGKAINRLIEAMSRRGGGTLYFSPGKYLSRRTIHLKNNVQICLGPGSTITTGKPGEFDPSAIRTDSDYREYEDFGHNHWRNSLIFGDDVENVRIFGPGRICGKGLSRDEWFTGDGTPPETAPGVANKAIAFKKGRNISLEDCEIVRDTGHFGILATGVQNLQMINLLIDTGRDGVDIDCCVGVKLIGLSINAPYDDCLVVKGSYALGKDGPNGCENILVQDCNVFGGYKVGTFRRDGSGELLPPDEGRKGRFKIGSETDKSIANVQFINCSCTDGMGPLITTVDGGDLINVKIIGYRGKNIHNQAFFVFRGARLRAPLPIEERGPGALKDVEIRDFRSEGSSNRPAMVFGLSGYSVENFSLRDAYILQEGGVQADWSHIALPEAAKDYPDTGMFGRKIPACGIDARDVKGFNLSNVEFYTRRPDRRPTVFLGNVENSKIRNVIGPPGSRAEFLHEEHRPLRPANSSVSFLRPVNPSASSEWQITPY
jgi:hypothetical protein